jgi:hypothetical protein
VSQPSREAHEAEQEEKAKEEGVPEGEVIYRSVRQDGEHALGLSSGALIWSGLAAGLSMGFCLIAKGLLIVHLPHAGWTPLVSSFGYTAGFLIVILGRQQLFTEQTLTAVLPLLARNRTLGSLSNVARLWAIVLAANIVGTAIIAGATALTPAFSQEAQAAFLEIGQKTMSHDLTTTFMRGIYAGYLIAVMVWIVDRRAVDILRRPRRTEPRNRRLLRLPVPSLQGRAHSRRVRHCVPAARACRKRRRWRDLRCGTRPLAARAR